MKGRNGKITHYSMFQNIPGYLRNTSAKSSTSIMDHLLQRQYYKPKGRSPFSAELMSYALLLCYTFAQCYKYLLNYFPLPSCSKLNKLKQGGLDSLKALKVLQRAGKISDDIIIMANEMYLQKLSLYHSGEYVGADADGNLYKGILVIMIVGLKKSIPGVVNAFPETSITGE